MFLKTKILVFILLFGLSLVLGVSMTYAASVFDLQPASTITYNEPVEVNGNFVVNGIGYFPQGVHIGQQGTGGVTFFNGTIINATTGRAGEDLPVTVGDGLRVDGLLWGGPNKGMAVDGKGLKIGDTMVPGLDNINDFGTASLRWKDGYFAGTLNVGSLGGKGIVTGGNIAQNTIGTDKLANGAVTSIKIADGTIATQDLTNNAVTSIKIADGTIATQDLTNNAVTSIKIADGTIASSDLADNSVTGVKILNGAITNVDVAESASIAASKIQDVWVNTTGDTMTGKLAITGSSGVTQGILEVTNSARDGKGVYGKVTNDASFGGYFEATGSTGAGVIGIGTGSTDGKVVGVEGVATNDTDIINYGGWFQAFGRRGRGVSGHASNSSGINYGGWFETASSSGYSGYFKGGNFTVNLGSTSNDFDIVNLNSGSGTNIVIDNNNHLHKTISSRRYKENIRELKVETAKVLQLKPVRFRYKSTKQEDIGLIAEDVNKIIPDLVVRDAQGRPDSVKYDRVSVYLLEVIKEQQKEIESLKSTICDKFPEEKICK